ncbi:MAG: hypothetical protein U0805_13800 [Pirellulales bacterium]
MITTPARADNATPLPPHTGVTRRQMHQDGSVSHAVKWHFPFDI